MSTSERHHTIKKTREATSTTSLSSSEDSGEHSDVLGYESSSSGNTDERPGKCSPKANYAGKHEYEESQRKFPSPRKPLHDNRYNEDKSNSKNTRFLEPIIAESLHRVTSEDKDSLDSAPLKNANLVCTMHNLVVFGVVIALIGVVIAMNTYQNSSPIRKTDSIPQFSETLQNMRAAFPKQSARFWSVLFAGTKSIINSKKHERPAVFIVVVPADARDTADCFVRKFTSMITVLLNARRPVEFTPKDVDKLTPEEIKHHLDDTLKDGLSSGSRVAVVHHLERLPGESAGMLHSFCDDSNAPFRDVVYVLKLNVGELTSLIKESDTFVRDRLHTLWGDQLGSNRFDPLLSRIAGSVAFLRPETNEILNQTCVDLL